MSREYEFRCCQSSFNRITLVDGRWQGEGIMPSRKEDIQVAIESCPREWDYLRAAGEQGWDLVGVARGAARILYLRREKY